MSKYSMNHHFSKEELYPDELDGCGDIINMRVSANKIFEEELLFSISKDSGDIVAISKVLCDNFVSVPNQALGSLVSYIQREIQILQERYYNKGYTMSIENGVVCHLTEALN